MPLGFGPAVLAGGWVAILLHARGDSAWLRAGIGATVIGALLAVAAAVVITLPLSVAGAASQVLSLLVLAWTVAAPALAATLRRGQQQYSVGIHLLAGLLYPVALVASFSFASNALPPGS